MAHSLYINLIIQLMGCINSKDIQGMIKKSQDIFHRTTNQKLRFQNYKKYTTQSEFAPYYQYMMQKPKVRVSQTQKILIKQILQHLMESRFHSEGINRTCELCYKLYKQGDHKDQYFWFLPFHILFFYAKTAVGQRTKKENFSLEEEIEKAIKNLAIKYPPTGNSTITDSQQIKNFKLNELPDLFQGRQFVGIEGFYALVQELNVQSHKLKQKFESLLQDIFKKRGNMKTFKAGTKLPKQQNMKYSKSLIRISQKYFAKFIDFKKFRNQVNYNGSYQDYFISWIESNKQQIIQKQYVGEENQQIAEGDQFLYEGQTNKKIHSFQTYDLLRAKCQFGSVSDIAQTLEIFKKKQTQGKLQIVVIKNRLNLGTKDVLVNIKFQNIVCEVQLALQFDKSDNQFNHKLYELIRDPAGIILACLLSVSSQDQEQLYFYRLLGSCCESSKQVMSFNFLLTILQQFIPSNVIPAQFNLNYSRTKPYTQPVYALSKWNCVYDQFQKWFQYQFDQFEAKNGLVEGQGVDLIGLYYVIGQIVGNNIQFQKIYYKKHTILYEGVKEDDEYKGTYRLIQQGEKSQPLGTFKLFYHDWSRQLTQL